MNDREELCKVISDAVGGWNPATRAITDVADAIIAAGWVKGTGMIERNHELANRLRARAEQVRMERKLNEDSQADDA